MRCFRSLIFGLTPEKSGVFLCLQKNNFIFFRKKFAQLNFTPLLCRTKEKNNEQNTNNNLGNRNALRFLPNQKPIYNYLHGVYRWLHFKKNSN